MTFLAPIAPAAGGAAARFLGSRMLGSAVSRLGAGAAARGTTASVAGSLPRGAGGMIGAGRGLSLAQFGAGALGGNTEPSQNTQGPTPFGGAV